MESIRTLPLVNRQHTCHALMMSHTSLSSVYTCSIASIACHATCQLEQVVVLRQIHTQVQRLNGVTQTHITPEVVGRLVWAGRFKSVACAPPTRGFTSAGAAVAASWVLSCRLWLT